MVLRLGVLVVMSIIASVSAYLDASTGNLGAMSTQCLTQLNNIFNDRYLLLSTAPSQDTRKDALYLTPARRLGCRLSLLEALMMTTNTTCPPEDQLINCFWISGKDWIALDKKCPVFKSQVPLPVCSDSPGEAAEGVPSCSVTGNAGASSITGRRRLLQGPANNAGIATWQYSNGEAQGLQYDPYAPTGSVYAQPPVAHSAGVTGADAAALRIAAEGNEGASVNVGSGTTAPASGCFPGMWSSQDFSDYLHGNLTETVRPKDYGGVNAVGLVSVLVYTILLCSLAAV